MIKKYFCLYVKTLIDIGPLRIFIRITEEIKKLIVKIAPTKILYNFAGFSSKPPQFLDLLGDFKIEENPDEVFVKNIKFKKIKFKFLNEKKLLKIPFNWNNKEWSKLWQFNLHYFDWSKEWLNKCLAKNNCKKEKLLLGILIDEWIKSNPLGKGYGWHSYTISLRIRNWIWIFRFFPELASKKRIESLWQQIIWLYLNPEIANGGNHLIENLISLIIGSLQFDGIKSKQIYSWALKKLKFELNEQILDDGGHFERSASYHFLILERLVELACVIQKIKFNSPIWLVEKILIMKVWGEKVYGKNKIIPPFNDSASEICPDIEAVINFAETFLYKKKYIYNDIRNFFLKNLNKLKVNKLSKNRSQKNNFVDDLKDTGWTILRFDSNWDLFFKNGIACPKYLPSHVHSDLLSFNLYYKSKPILIETGTSLYENGSIRKFERSGEAHNVIQFALHNNQIQEENWLESVEVWDNFRAGRKASPIKRGYGFLNDDGLWVNGSHDGFNSIGVKHTREIRIKKISTFEMKLCIFDFINTSKIINWRLCFHLGPSQSKEILKPTIKKIKEQFNSKYYWKKTWYSKSFGERYKRDSLFICGILNPGYRVIKSEIKIGSKNK